MKIFIVEDDSDIREMEAYALKNSGFDVRQFNSADTFYPELKNEIPDLVILDIMLPGEDGLKILEKLRKNSATASIPVMMVTAKTTELDKVKGLDMGADDYISKPFGIMEFVSRAKALLRRTARVSEESTTIVFGEIVIDDEKRIVKGDGNICELTYKEYELLKLLVLNPNVVLSREKILDNVWGYEYGGETRTVDMHIKTLRQKLGKCGAAIKTVRNVGYKLGDI